MRIIHVVRIPATVERFLIPFIHAQTAQGHNTSVACSSKENIQSLQAAGINVHTYPLHKSLCISNIWRGIKNLKHIFETQNCELVIAHMHLAGAISRIAAKLARGKPVIIYVSHGLPCMPQQNKIKWLFWLAVEWILGRITDAMLVMNSYDYKLARKVRLNRNPELIFKIPGMGVDVKKFCPLQEKDSDAFWPQFGINKSKVVVCVARLVKEKGVMEFLEVADTMRNNNCGFVLIGDGPLYNKVISFIRNKHLEDSVFALGPRYDVVEFVKRCDLFILPTYYCEGLPVAILEAMACGKPVVTTKHRGCEDIVIDGVTGFLVEKHNTLQLIEKTNILLNDEALCLRMGQASRERVKQHFSLEDSVKDFCKAISIITG